MYNNFEAFKNYLIDHSKNPALVLPNSELIYPLFTIVENGHYSFGRVENINHKEAAEAISLAIGKTVRKIIPVFAPQPFSKTEWTNTFMRYRSFDDILERNFGGVTPCWDRLYYNAMEKNFAINLRDILWKSLWDLLNDSSWDSLTDVFRHRFFDNVMFQLQRSQINSLLYFFSFVLYGDSQKVEQLTPLIKQLIIKGYIPLGSKVDEPDAMFVFGV